MLFYSESYLRDNKARLGELREQMGEPVFKAAVDIFPNPDGLSSDLVAEVIEVADAYSAKKREQLDALIAEAKRQKAQAAPPKADKPKRVRKKATKLQAYYVTDNDECSCIVFAKTNMQARRQGAQEISDGEWEYVSCRREPKYDRFVEQGRVPWLQLWRDGWWFECECGRRIDDDWGYCEATSEPNRYMRKEPVDYKGHLYCTPWCVLGSAERRAERLLRDRLARTMARLSGKLDGCTIIGAHYDTREVELQGPLLPERPEDRWWSTYPRQLRRTVAHYTVDFTFPGSQGRGKWDHTDPAHVTVERRDLDAWHAFKGTTP